MNDPGSESLLPQSWDAMVTVGRVARPHGLRGEVVINPATDFVEERFAPGGTLHTQANESLTVATLRVHGGRPIVRFEGFSRIEDAERLAGVELRVPESALRPLGPHTYYEHQLAGCVVETVAGAPVGTVSRVDGGTSGSLLVIAGVHGEILVPLTQAICREIEVAAKRIRIDPPEGLLELNEGRQSAAGSRPGGKRQT